MNLESTPSINQDPYKWKYNTLQMLVIVTEGYTSQHKSDLERHFWRNFCTERACDIGNYHQTPGGN